MYQNLDTENSKLSLKKTEDDLSKWKNTPYSKIRRINIVKLAVLLNLQFQCNPYQNPSCLLAEIDKLIPKFIQINKGTKIAKIILGKK